LAVKDHNDHRADIEIGSATFDLGRLAEDATLPGQESKVLRDGKEKGELRYDM
jgi:Ca2+-dependent lipid-binding protein